MLPLMLIRRPLTPAQADAIIRRAWIVPACFYAAGVAAALILVALIALGVPALGLRYGLAIVCILFVTFIPAAVAYARAQPPTDGHCHHDAPGGTHGHRADDHRGRYICPQSQRWIRMGTK